MPFRYVQLIIIPFVLVAVWLQSGITELEDRHYFTHMANNLLFILQSYIIAFLVSWKIQNRMAKLIASAHVVLGIILFTSNLFNIWESWSGFFIKTLWLGLLVLTPILVLRRQE